MLHNSFEGMALQFLETGFFIKGCIASGLCSTFASLLPSGFYKIMSWHDNVLIQSCHEPVITGLRGTT